MKAYCGYSYMTPRQMNNTTFVYAISHWRGLPGMSVYRTFLTPCTPRSTCTIITETFFICGDFNSRCGERADYVEGVDQVPSRHVIDHTTNGYGDCLCDFLVSTSCLIINGRSADGKNILHHLMQRVNRWLINVLLLMIV